MEQTAHLQRARAGAAERPETFSGWSIGEIPAVLDGTLPVQTDALAALLRERVRLAADWFLPIQRPDGSFAYTYDPERDHYTYVPYNEVRHAGATYALFQACQRFDDQTLRTCASRAAEFIVHSSLSVPSGGAAYLYDGRAKLGGVALAIVALLEGRRALAVETWDDTAVALGDFILGMELPGEPGRYFQSYDAAAHEKLMTPNSDYYPGEALLALTRLHRAFPDGPWLAAAQRAARYLIRVKDGDQIERGAVPRIDHWLTIALSDLYRFDPNPDYAAIVFLQADRMSGSQYPVDDPQPWRIGAARRAPTPNFTSTATHAEALNAAWGLARALGDIDAVERCSQAALRSVQFLLRVQFTAANTSRFTHPERAIGAWAHDIGHAQIRFDYVQHGLSALIGAAQMLEEAEQASQAAVAPLDPPAKSERTAADPHRTQALGVEVRSVLAAAEQRGIPVRSLDVAREMVELGSGAYSRRFWGLATSGTSVHGVKIAKDKHLASQLLRDAGLPAPRSVVVATADQAMRAAARLGYPVVLKPNRGNKGRDVYVDIESDAELNELIASVFGGRLHGEWLVEQFVAGNEHRILVVGGQVVGVNRRIPPSVTGNGSSTVQELIDEVNADPARSNVRGTPLKPVPLGAQLFETLRRQHLDLDSVPESGRLVPLNAISNVSTGGATRDVTDRIHPDNARVACLAAEVAGLDFAGIDLVVPDIEQSIWETGGGIVEINSNPGMIDHLEPYQGVPRDVGAAILAMLYPPGQRVRAQIVAVLASDESAAICRVLAHLLAAAGWSVGIAGMDGLSIAGMAMLGVETRHPFGIRTLLNNPAVEVAIVEIERAAIEAHGLGFDACDVAVFAAPIDGAAKPGVRSPEAVLVDALDPTGAVVLDVATKGSLDAAGKAGRRIVPFAPRQNAKADELGNREPAVVLRGRGKMRGIAVVDSGHTETVVPAALLASISEAHALSALMAAVAAAVALDIPAKTIRVALETFDFHS